MKPHRAIFSSIIYILVINLTLNSCDDTSEKFNSFSSETRSSEIDRNYNVSPNDVLTIANAINHKYVIKDTANIVRCLLDEVNDTLLYACNKVKGGWTLFSSDKRLPAIIMDTSSGDFDEFFNDKMNKFWINTLINEVRVLKKLNNNELAFSDEEIQNNMNFWNSISNPDEFFSDSRYQLSKKPEINPGLTLIPNGHYELYKSYTYEVIYDSIPRLTTTDWDTGAPFNLYCPFNSSYKDHASAGTVAVAAAQMLYFMHNEFGVPQTAPSEAYCKNSVSDSIYVWDQTNYTETIWEQMKNDPSAAAPLIANIGKRINARYFDNGTATKPKELINKVFKPYGLSAEYIKYNVDILKNNLLNKLPVIIEARDNDAKYPEAFIVDRYRRSAYQTTNIYHYTYDNLPEGTMIPYVKDSVVYSYKTPYIDQIGINWGNGAVYQKPNKWYPITGDWRITDYWPYNYNENRNIIYFITTGLIRRE